MSERPTKEQVDRALEEQRKMVWCGFDEPESWKGVLAAEVLALREELRHNARALNDLGDAGAVEVALKYAPRSEDVSIETATMVAKSHCILAQQVVHLRATIARVEELPAAWRTETSGLRRNHDDDVSFCIADLEAALKGTP